MTDAFDPIEDKPNKLAEAITRALGWAYDAVLSGGPGFDSIEQLAKSYSKRPGAVRDHARSLVRWQTSKAGAIGFVTGLPGLPFMAATIPANLGAVLCIQLRMSGAIAVLGGHDAKADQVRSFATICLAGSGASEVVRDFSMAFSMKLANAMVEKISGKALIEINKTVGFKLATKFGEKGLVNFGKAIPLVGGVVGGGFDAVTTRAVGKSAIKLFIDG